MDRLSGVRAELNNLDGDIKAECARFSEDIKYGVFRVVQFHYDQLQHHSFV